MKRIVVILFSILMIAAATGCDGLAALELPVSQIPESSTVVVSPTPADSPTPWPTTTFQFPPTWTPDWVKPATATPVIKTRTPSVNETSISGVGTPIYPTGLFTILGTVSQKTSTIPFKASTITLVWKYSGGPGEQKNLVAANDMHKDRLNSLYSSMTQTLAQYNNNLADANNANNSSQISYWTDQIKQLKAAYQQDIDKESIRYQTQIGKITTAFSVQINRISVNKPATLVTAKGLYIGQVTYKTVSAADYYFTIQTSGPFQIDITR